MRRLVVSVAALSLALMVGSTALHSNPPKPPPEIQAIIDKQKHGGKLTADDIAKLQAWASGVAQRLPANLPEPPHAGSADTSTDAVPVRFDVTAHYERRTSNGIEEFDIDAWAPMRLTAKIAGTDSYVSGMLDPKAKTSSFYFQPAPTYGDGSYRYHAVTDETTDLTAQMSHVSGAVMFATIGGDRLGIIPGSFGGDVKGTYHTVDKHGKNHSHAYEGSMQEWKPDLLFPWEGHVTKDRTQPVPNPRAQLSYKKLVAAAQSDKPTQLEITEHFDWHDHGESVTGDITVKVSFHPQPQPEVRILADSDWASWEPEGETPKKSGNEFTVHLAVVDSETGKPIVDKKMQVASASFELKEVSHLPGVCGNYPPKSSSSEDKQPDLRFSTKNTGTVPDAPRQTLQLDHTNWNAPVIVEARDFAAYGKLTAKVTLQDGREIDAKFLRTVEPTITVTEVTLPRDDDNNKIADAWQDHLGMDPKADDEDTPQGMHTQGDGLTVMEEYRGFLVSEHRNAIPATDETHVRLSATQRELFVIKEVDDLDKSAAVEQGFALFEKIAQMRVLAVASMDRLGSRTGDVGTHKRGVVLYAAPDGSTSADPAMGTMGVWVSAKVPPPPVIARTEPLLHPDYQDTDQAIFSMFGSPARIRWISIGSADEAKGTLDLMLNEVDPATDSCCPNAKKLNAEYFTANKITNAQRVAAAKYGRAHYTELLAEMNAFAVAHELGHAIGATHHGITNAVDPDDPDDVYDTTGDDACPMRYWQVQRTHGPRNIGNWVDFVGGKWNPLVSSPHGPWKFCVFNMPQMSVKTR